MREHLRATGAIPVALLIVAVMSACGGQAGVLPGAGSDQSTAHFPMSVRETDGTTLTLAAAPRRIVSLSAAATEIFCAVGAGSQLAAVELNANCPTGTTSKPALDAYQPSPERIVSLQPDLVYVFADVSGSVASLRRLGIPVLYLPLPATLQQSFDQMSLLGRISGHAAQADRLVQNLRDRLASIKRTISSVGSGPSFYDELDPTYFTVSDHSFVGDLFAILKGRNIAAAATQEYPQLSAEVIIQSDPQVIVISDGPAGVTADTIRQRAGWQQLSAVQTNRICTVSPDAVNVPGPRIVDGLSALAQCLYPDRFR